VLLLAGEGTNGATSGAGFTDESFVARGAGTAQGNGQISTAQFKFGSSSYLFDGTGDGIFFADSADWALGSSNSSLWGVEAWIRPATTTPGNTVIVSQSAGLGAAAFYFWLDGSNQITFWGSAAGTSFDWSANPTSAGLTWTAGQWYHVAADHDASGKVRVYRDGTMVGSSTPTTSSIANTSAPLGVGIGGVGERSFNGYIDEVRVLKGYAPYANDGGYTVPTAAFPRS
jgi:hypothetical protein